MYFCDEINLSMRADPIHKVERKHCQSQIQLLEKQKSHEQTKRPHDFCENVCHQLWKDTIIDYPDNHDNDNAPNCFMYLRDGRGKTLSITLWKERKIILLHMDWEQHLDDDGKLITTIMKNPKDIIYCDLSIYNEVTGYINKEETFQNIFKIALVK